MTEERGRGKTKPRVGLHKEDIRAILLEKIQEEMSQTEAIGIEIPLEEITYVKGKAHTLSLFSGAGGLDLGFELAGLSSVIGEEKAKEAFSNKAVYNQFREKSCLQTVYVNDFFSEALQTYKQNHPSHVFIHQADIRKIKTFPKADLVLGGFPCPGFSEAGPRLLDDERNFLYLHFIRCLMQVQPKVFVAENVKGMMTLGKGEVFRQIVEDFEAAGYKVKAQLVNARDYGVPQLRERVFLVGVREDVSFDYEFPLPTHGENCLHAHITLKDAIGDLEKNPGVFYTGSYSPMYMSRNRKKKWDEQSFTIQASGRQAPLHPSGVPMEKRGRDQWIFPDGEDKHRRLSVSEIKRIQTFPDWYDFYSNEKGYPVTNHDVNKIYKQVGNAVPVQLAYEIALPIVHWFAKQTN